MPLAVALSAASALLAASPAWLAGAPSAAARGRVGTRRTVRPAAAQAPTWSDLQSLAAEAEAGAGAAAPPALTLYRDTNGWCPFCERVWIAVREKGIPYDEVLINLYDKPQWYKDMVPTELVPAVKFADSEEVVWESDAIMRRLDEAFPDKPLFAEPERVEASMKFTDSLMNASMGLAYRSGNFTEEPLESRRAKLIAAVDGLEAHLAEGGPFLLGDEVSAADLMAVPMLERYGVQLPYFAAELQIRDPERWPSVARWFDAMESRPAYADRVSGDLYSWTAVAPVLMRLFGGQNGTLEGAAAERALAAEEEAAKILIGVEAGAGDALAMAAVEARLEAVGKLLGNRVAVIADATNTEPTSQKELRRLDPSKAPVVDAALRASAAAVLAGSLPDEAPAVDMEGVAIDPADLAQACRYVAARLCIPRDMGAPAGAALRGALLGLARLAERVAA